MWRAIHRTTAKLLRVLGPSPSLTNKIYDRCSQQQSWRPQTAFKKTVTKQIYLEYPHPRPKPNKHNINSE